MYQASKLVAARQLPSVWLALLALFPPHSGPSTLKSPAWQLRALTAAPDCDKEQHGNFETGHGPVIVDVGGTKHSSEEYSDSLV
jgi:hypothetical protein